MRARIRAVTAWGAANLLAMGVLSGCSMQQIGGVAATDSSSAFSAFSRPQRPNDVVPAAVWTPLDTSPSRSDLHNDRKIAAGEDLAVYLVHAQPDVLCLVVQDLPGQASGGQDCDDGPTVVAHSMTLGWATTSDPGHDRTAVLVPDGYTATVTRGTFVLAGQGVVVAQGDGVEVALTNNAGRTLRLFGPTRSQR